MQNFRPLEMENKRLPQLASEHDCTGCMACVGVCKSDALTMRKREDGHGYPSFDAKKCVRCLRCEQVCQATRSFIGSNDLQLSSPYAAWANDGALRSRSTSGGFAAVVARHFLENGNGVVGVSFDGWKATHILIDKEGDLGKFQGSKYVWSDASEAYSAIAENLPKRPVLFVGTGCQVAGMLSFFSSHPNRDRLFTIDLICGGVPSDLLMQVYRDAHPEVEAITSFRTKRKYEIKGIIDGKEVVLPKQSLPLSGFFAEQTMRHTCYDCPFALAHRQSDITIGDLWGESAPAEQRDRGVSLVVVHTEKGHRMLCDADVMAEPVEWSRILLWNKRLVYGHTPKTVLRRNLVKNYHRMDGATFSRYYGFSSSPRFPIGFAMRIWYYLKRKIDGKRSQKTIEKILNANKV